MTSLMWKPYCGTFMQLQVTHGDPRVWILSKQEITHPGQDSHKTMRHRTAPQHTKPLRVTWCRPGRESDLKTLAPRKSRNHSSGPSIATGIQYYTIVGVTTKWNTHTCNTHKHVVHTWHRQIPCSVKKGELVRYGSLSFLECNFCWYL